MLCVTLDTLKAEKGEKSKEVGHTVRLLCMSAQVWVIGGTWVLLTSEGVHGQDRFCLRSSDLQRGAPNWVLQMHADMNRWLPAWQRANFVTIRITRATLLWWEREILLLIVGLRRKTSIHWVVRIMGLFVTTNGSYSFRCTGSGESIKFKDKSSVKHDCHLYSGIVP